eukprot:TRINITY_DN7132_c0_g1_i1.p1 TRINITY_DN7132_c0_g1~~TRINITY_DN7132_c0_g1_i1.p1  ORF type:complete len:471 (-),score=126.58 TRINITY_DN7132_c0_g1_i1:46-1458(-)
MPPAAKAAASTTPTPKKFTWDQIKDHRSKDDCWIVVQGKVYDVTSWTGRHPGGDVILTGGGRESTALFYSYHPRKVLPMIEKYYIGDVANYDTYYTYDSPFYATVKNRVDEYMSQNNMTRDTFVMYFKTFLVLSCWAMSYYLGMLKGYSLAVVFLGLCHAQIGINIMHDGNHGAYSSNTFLSWFAGFMMDLMGASSIVWLHQHNIGHHPNCNNSDDTHKESERLNPLAFDPDTNSGYPFLRLHPRHPVKPWHRFQQFYFWILILVVLFKWFINDVRSVLSRRYSLVKYYGITEWEVTRLFLTKAFFCLYMIVIPFMVLPSVTKALVQFTIFMCVTGYAFVLLFSVNHLTEETSHPSFNTEERDWAKLQVLTSSNFANNSTFWTWFSGGLNFQIEHHLFPGVNHTHLPKISPIVRQACKEFNVHYTEYPTFWSAVASHYTYLRLLGSGEDLAGDKTKTKTTGKNTKKAKQG